MGFNDDDVWSDGGRWGRWCTIEWIDVILRKVAVADATICGCSDAASQTIRQAVNEDLNRIVALGMVEEIKHRRWEYVKVSCAALASLLIRDIGWGNVCHETLF